MRLPLRLYQDEAVDEMKNYQGDAALLVLATGLGKTVIFSEFLRYEVLENDHQCFVHYNNQTSFFTQKLIRPNCDVLQYQDMAEINHSTYNFILSKRRFKVHLYLPKQVFAQTL